MASGERLYEVVSLRIFSHFFHVLIIF